MLDHRFGIEGPRETAFAALKALATLRVMAILVVLSGCVMSTLNPPRSRFTPVVDGLSFSPRASIDVVKSEDIDESTYTRIGSVETSLLLSRCDSDVGQKDCSSTGRTGDDAMAAALAKAQKAGGDIAVVSRSFTDAEYGTRPGMCTSYSTSTERVSTYQAGDSSTSSTTKTVRKCVRYEQIRTRSTYQTVILTVYRAEEGLDQKISEGVALAEAKAAREAEAQREQQALAAAAQAEKRREAEAAARVEAAAKAERDAFAAIIRTGTEAEVTRALAEKPAFRDLELRYEPLSTEKYEVKVDLLRYAITNLNVDAVRALLADGADPNGKPWKVRDQVAPPLWHALNVYRIHNSCASLIMGRPLSGYLDNYRTAQGEHKALLIIRELIKAGADVRSTAPGKSTITMVMFGFEDIQTMRFLRVFGKVGECQPEGEQGELLRLVLDAGAYERAIAADTIKALHARADDWEQRLLPDSEARARSEDPEERARGEAWVAMRQSVIRDSRHLIDVLNAESRGS